MWCLPSLELRMLLGIGYGALGMGDGALVISSPHPPHPLTHSSREKRVSQSMAGGLCPLLTISKIFLEVLG